MTKTNQNLAIIIGIDDYIHIPKLKNAVADAQAIATVLQKRYEYDVLLLLNQRATKEKFDQLLESLTNKTIQFDHKSIQIGNNDRLFFYFAGHGLAEEVQDSEDGKPAGYFMPQDAQNSNDSDTWLSMQKLYEVFTELNCHHLLMILDCCFAGRISWAGQGRNAARPRKLYQQSYDRFIKYPTQQIITSAAHDEKAQDSFRFGQRGNQNGHSPFAYLLLKVLDRFDEGKESDGGKDKLVEAIHEDKVITAQELFTYLQNELGKIAEGQTPSIFQPRKRDPKTGEYIFFKGEYIFTIDNSARDKLPKLKLDKNSNPYKGLASFETEDSDLFFGRKRLIEGSKNPEDSNQSQEGLLSQVINIKHRLTVVLGVSGSGKSSLVKAGLIPALQRPKENSQEPWYVLNTMRPGEHPIISLSRVILPIKNIELVNQLPQVNFLDNIFKTLDKQDQQSGLSSTEIKNLKNIAKDWESANKKTKLLLILDHFEQIKNLCKNLCSESQQKNLSQLKKSISEALESLRKELNNSSQNLTLVNIFSSYMEKNQNKNLLLTIDQSEELITLCKDEQERKNFLRLLTEVLNNRELPTKVHIVLTLRSDFEPQIREAMEAGKTHWQEGRFIVTPMNREELQQVIEEPAAQRALFFESPKLVNSLIDEVIQMPGALSLLSFTLSQLYLEYLDAENENGRDDRTIKEDDYKKIGGVTRSLTDAADTTYNSLTENKQQKVNESTIRDVMLRMVASGGGEIARRRVPLSELEYPGQKNEEAKTVIDSFLEARLLVKGLNEKNQEYVEPVHDALIIGWVKIRTWLEEKQEIKSVSEQYSIRKWLNTSLVKDSLPSVSEEKSNKGDLTKTEKQLKVDINLQRELNTAANNWFIYNNSKNKSENKKAVGFLWDDDPRLPQLKQIQQSHDNWFNEIESQFVETSIKTKQRKTRNVWIAVSLAFLGVTSFVFYVLWQLQLSQLRQKAASAENLLSTDPVKGLVVAIEAIGQNLDTPIVNMNILPEVKSSLLAAVQTSKERNQLTQDSITAIALSPDGKKIASADTDGNVYLRDLQEDRQQRLFKETINNLAFSPDGNILIASRVGDNLHQTENEPTSNTSSAVKFWDLQQNKFIQPFVTDSTKIVNANFSPDGRFIFGTGSDGNIYWQDLQSSPSVKPRLKKNDKKNFYHAVAVNHDAKTIASIATSGNDNKFCLYLFKFHGNQLKNVNHENCYQTIDVQQWKFKSIAFNKTGDSILINLVPDYSELSSNYKSFAFLLSLIQENEWICSTFEVTSPGFLSKVLSAAFSPDGNNIVTGDQDGNIRQWGNKEEDNVSYPHDNSICLSNNKVQEIFQPLLGHSQIVESIAFSSDGKTIISRSLDGTIRLWDTGQNLSKESLSNQIKSGAGIFSPDGQKVAVGSKNRNQGIVTLWDITGKKIDQITTNSTIAENGEIDPGQPIAVACNGLYVLIREDGKTILWHPGSNSKPIPIRSPKTKTVPFSSPFFISPDSQRIVGIVSDESDSNLEKKYIQLWDINGNHVGQPEPVKNDKGFSLESLAFSPDGKHIVSRSDSSPFMGGASYQFSVCLWNIQADSLNKKNCKSIPGTLSQMVFSPDSKTIAIGQDNGGLYLWNPQTNTISSRFGGNNHSILAIAFSSDKKTIASGDRTGSVRLWNLDGTPIGRAFQSYTNSENAVAVIKFNPDGKTMVVTYTDGSVREWQINWQDWLKVGCNRLRDHPELKMPNDDKASKAKKTCEKYVWNQ